MRKYLKLYKKWVKTGYIQDKPNPSGSGGLCNTVVGKEIDKMFNPNNDGIYVSNWIYWANESHQGDTSREACYGFNGLRQNIVLLLAAINNEL